MKAVEDASLIFFLDIFEQSLDEFLKESVKDLSEELRDELLYSFRFPG